MSSLGEEYPKEQARVRELLGQYQRLRDMPGVNPMFAIMSLEEILRRADKAAVEGDVVEMLRCFQEMRGCE